MKRPDDFTIAAACFVLALVLIAISITLTALD